MIRTPKTQLPVRSISLTAFVTCLLCFLVSDVTKAQEDGKTSPEASPAMEDLSTSLSKIEPEWFADGDYFAEDVEYRVVSVGPSLTKRISEEQLESAMSEYTASYIDRHLEYDASKFVVFSPSYIRKKLVREDRYVQKYIRNRHSTNYYGFAQLAFDREFDGEIERAWEEVLQKYRLYQVGLWVAGVLIVLLIAFGYLQLDHATRGFYTGRLQWLAGFLFLGTIASEMVVAWLIKWP